MPQTHWWRWKSAPSTEYLRKAIDEMVEIVADHRLLVAGPSGHDLVDCFDQVVPFQNGNIVVVPSIALNGRHPADSDPFVFPGRVFPVGGTPAINKCKTEGLPYDLVVSGCLEIARKHFDDMLETCFGEEAPGWEGYFRNPTA